MNNNIPLESSANQVRSFHSSISSWKNKIHCWLKRSWLGLAGIGLLGFLSLGLLLSSLAFVWFLALLAPAEFENLADKLIERLPALLIATPLGILLGAGAIALLLGSSLGLVLLNWLAKRFELPKKLLERWQDKKSSTQRVNESKAALSPTSRNQG